MYFSYAAVLDAVRLFDNGKALLFGRPVPLEPRPDLTQSDQISTVGALLQAGGPSRDRHGSDTLRIKPS